MAQQAAQAETARRMARLAFIRQKRAEAVLRAIVGQLRIRHVEPDYPIEIACESPGFLLLNQSTTLGSMCPEDSALPG